MPERLKVGDHGERVRQLQTLLVYLKCLDYASISGVFDSATEDAVRAFQETSMGVQPSGEVDEATWRSLTDGVPAMPTLDIGSTGDVVQRLQRALNAYRVEAPDIPELTVDGNYGPRTKFAVEMFQEAQGVTVDGICGPQTWTVPLGTAGMTLASLSAAYLDPDPGSSGAAEPSPPHEDRDPADPHQLLLTMGDEKVVIEVDPTEDQVQALLDALARDSDAASHPSPPVPSPAAAPAPAPPSPAPRRLGPVLLGPPLAGAAPGGTDYDRRLREAIDGVVKRGRMVFNPPETMHLGAASRVEVRITRSTELDDVITSDLRGAAPPQLETIPTSVYMGVSLQGAGFDVAAFSDEEQVVTDSDATTWEYEVVARKRGTQTLVLSVSLRIPVAGEPDRRRSVPVLERRIEVEVTKLELVGAFAKSNWQWIAGTVIGLAGAIAAWETLIR
jgi:hypothetical protein